MRRRVRSPASVSLPGRQDLCPLGLEQSRDRSGLRAVTARRSQHREGGLRRGLVVFLAADDDRRTWDHCRESPPNANGPRRLQSQEDQSGMWRAVSNESQRLCGRSEAHGVATDLDQQIANHTSEGLIVIDNEQSHGTSVQATLTRCAITYSSRFLTQTSQIPLKLAACYQIATVHMCAVTVCPRSTESECVCQIASC